MSLLAMSDSQIREIAKPILMDTIIGAKYKDWHLFAKHMLAKYKTNADMQADVERQWEEDKYLTAFSEEPEFLAIIRKKDEVLVLWRLTSSESEEEYVEKLYLQEDNGAIVMTGIWTE